MYGMTETLRSTYLAPEDADTRPTSISKPIPNANISVLRADGTPCDPGEVGELVQKGPLIARGYWNDAARTANVFRPIPGDGPEPAVWSGDMVKCDADGFIYFMGRRDEIMKIRGYRVSPVEIEDVVLASGQAGQAAALCVPAGETDQSLVVYVTPKGDQAPNPGAILDHCRAQLPPYLVPSQILVRPALPLTANGKLERKKLLAEHLTAPAEIQVPPTNSAVAEQSAGFFRRWKSEAAHLLGVQKHAFKNVREVFAWAFPGRPITATDTFLSLEGDSLTYVSVSTGIEDILGQLPDAWEQMPINALERLRRISHTKISLRPDIALRALAIVVIVIVHARYDDLAGGAALLMLLSGFSFARFNWSDSGRDVFTSALRLTGRILVPTWILLASIFLYRGEITWSALFFYNNWTALGLIWWPPAWFLQVLFQLFLFMSILALIPGVGRFGKDHRFAFGLILVAIGFALDTTTILLGKLYWHMPPTFVYHYFPQYFLWIFGSGWLVAVAKPGTQKMVSYLALVAVAVAVIVIHGVAPFHYLYGGDALIWLLGGGALLFWAPAILAPKAIGNIVTMLAKSTLYVYLFHWPLATFIKVILHLHNRPLEIGLGFLASLVLWVFWESTLRASRRNTNNLSPSQDDAILAT